MITALHILSFRRCAQCRGGICFSASTSRFLVAFVPRNDKRSRITTSDKSGGPLTDRPPPRCSRASLGGGSFGSPQDKLRPPLRKTTDPESPSPELRSPLPGLEHR